MRRSPKRDWDIGELLEPVGPRASKRASMLVLLVEDHEDTLQLDSEYLRMGGFRVVETLTSATAFAGALETRPDVR
jgi:PleD family two-component response regulator